MSSGESDTEDLQPRNVPCRSPSLQPCVTPSVPEVSLMFSNVPWANARTSTTAAYGTPGYLRHETNVQERWNVGSNIGCVGDLAVLNCGNDQSSQEDENKLLQHSSHKPDVISGVTKLDHFYSSNTNVMRDNRNIESEVITNSKRAFLPRTFSNKCNTINKNKDSHGAQQNYCSHDNSVSNRKHDRFPNQHNISPKTNVNSESDRSIWSDVNGQRHFHGSAYHLKPGGDKCRMEKNSYKRHQKKMNSEGKCSSDAGNSGENGCYFNKEQSPYYQQVTCLSADPQEITKAECSAHIQDSVTNDNKALFLSPPRSSFSCEREKYRDIRPSSGPDLRHQNQFHLHSLTPNTGNHNLETRSGGMCTRNQIQSTSILDYSEGIDGSQAQLGKVKELGGQDKSLSDLYSLVHLQNEQLKYLQAQVDTLLLTTEKNGSVFTSPRVGIQSVKKQITVVDESTQTMVADMHHEVAVNTDPRLVVSVGIMTSLTDTADLQQSQDTKKVDFCNTRPSSACHQCPVHAEESSDETIYFNSMDLPTVQEQVPSPVSSVHVDMQDYEDDELDGTEIAQHMECNNGDHIQHRETEGANRIGWTFYNNVVGQVNKLLKDLPRDNECDNRYGAEQDTQRLYECEEDVKNTTVDQLRKMGISFCNPGRNDAPAEVKRAQQFDSMHYPHLGIMPITSEGCESDSSIQINTLALKYLKHGDQGIGAERLQDVTFYNMEMKTTNLSLGTLKYLERYHLLPSQGETGGGVAQMKVGDKPEECAERLSRPGSGARGEAKVKGPCRQPQNSTNKILDITTLKRQPKLL